MEPQYHSSTIPECDVPVPRIFNFFGGIGNGIGTNWYRKKVSEPVSEKSLGTGTEKIGHLLRKG